MNPENYVKCASAAIVCKLMNHSIDIYHQMDKIVELHDKYLEVLKWNTITRVKGIDMISTTMTHRESDISLLDEVCELFKSVDRSLLLEEIVLSNIMASAYKKLDEWKRNGMK